MHASETDTLGTAEHRYPIFPYFCLIKTITSPETSPFLELTLVDITKTKVKTAKEPLLYSLFEIDGPARLAQLEQHPGRRLDGGRRVPVLGLGGLGKPLARQLGEPLPRDLGARRGAALPVSGVAEPKHLKKMTSPFPCRILSLRNLLLHST